MKRHLIGVLGSLLLLCLTTAAFATPSGTTVYCNNFGGPDRGDDYLWKNDFCWHIEVKCEKDIDLASFFVSMSYAEHELELLADAAGGQSCDRFGISDGAKQETLKCEFFGGAKVEASIKRTDPGKCDLS